MLILSVLAAGTAAGARPAADGPSGVKLGLRAEYFSLAVEWDGPAAAQTSDLKSGLVAAELKFALGRGSSLSVFAGYGASDIGDLAFRSLPFSIDYGAGGGGGAAVGGTLDLALTSGPPIGVGLLAEVTAFMGSTRRRDIPGLAVAGSLEARPAWYRAKVGPVFAFGAGDRVKPYLFPFFHYLQGTFELRESIETLKGEEKRELKGKSQFGVAGGLDLTLSPGLKLRAEAGLYPGGGRTGTALSLATVFSF